ncbi:hypothetical protein [Sphingomonas sp. LM7]|uniref:hypothetical protein n=1 Tax=Sphingomonas sp. LM7 TaxID=1938607 RepID=UPI00123707E2|nr:hypothetical protein [Sphingomonas sp. LM7]
MTEESEGAAARVSTTGWPDVMKAAIWPVFALIAVAIFFTPISGILRNTADKATLNELNMGPLQVKLSAAAEKLRAPAPAIAKMVAGLDSAQVEELINWNENALSVQFCLNPAPLGDPRWGRLTDDYVRGRIEDARAYRGMIEAGIFTAEPVETQPTGCSDSVAITPDGLRAKHFLLDLLTNALELSTK